MWKRKLHCYYVIIIDGCSCLPGQEGGCVGLCSTFTSRYTYDIKLAWITALANTWNALLRQLIYPPNLWRFAPKISLLYDYAPDRHHMGTGWYLCQCWMHSKEVDAPSLSAWPGCQGNKILLCPWFILMALCDTRIRGLMAGQYLKQPIHGKLIK